MSVRRDGAVSCASRAAAGWLGVQAGLACYLFFVLLAAGLPLAAVLLWQGMRERAAWVAAAWCLAALCWSGRRLLARRRACCRGSGSS